MCRLLVVCVAVAALVAVAATPVVLIVGAVAEAGTEAIESIPPLPEPPLPQRSTLLAADGSHLADVYLQNRVVVDASAMSPLVRDAVVAVEDVRFAEHRGVDVRGTLRALVANTADGERSQGGSTITQQYVKNVLAAAADSNAARQRATAKNYQRKLLEAHYALELETRLSKDEILTRYLNIAYFGAGAYGIEAAARTYFGVSAAELSLPQAAALAASLQSPSKVNPLDAPDAALQRRNAVLAAMSDAGSVSEPDAAAAAASPLEVHPTAAPNGCTASPYPFFCDWALSTLPNSPALGATGEQRAAALAAGGLTITTTLDPRAQAAAQTAVDELPRDGRVAAAMVTVTPGTGAVTALAVNRDYGTVAPATVLALATDAHTQGGSTFKAFTLAAALEAGVALSDRLPAGGTYTSPLFENPPAGFYSNAEGSGRSNLTVAEAAVASSNTAFVQLSEKVGVPAVADMAHRLGVTSIPVEGPDAPGPQEGSFTLGARNVSVLELANSYATLAAGGVRCTPTAVAAVGPEPVPADCARVLDADVAVAVTTVLVDVVASGTGRAAGIGRPVAGKTGTTNDFGAALFAGYTPTRATAVWVGDPRGPAFPLLDVAGVSRVYGGTIPAEMFASEMRALHDGEPVVEFPAAGDGYLVAVGAATVPDVVGMTVPAAAGVLERAGVPFTVDEAGARPGVANGVVVATSPAPGAPLRGPVTLQATSR